MVKPRRRVPRRSKTKTPQNLQSTSATLRKRKTNKRKDAVHPTHSVQRKRRTSRYNLRRSNSVILVGESPCCKSRQQLEKYTRLGLNTALFLSGSRKPRRKQSHISIITISSGDEEISMVRTAEWVASLNSKRQLSVESDHLNGNFKQTLDHIPEEPVCITEDLRHQISSLHIPAGPEQTYQPPCASTLESLPDLQSAPATESQVEQNIGFLPSPSTTSFLANQMNFGPFCKNIHSEPNTENTYR